VKEENEGAVTDSKTLWNESVRLDRHRPRLAAMTLISVLNIKCPHCHQLIFG